jgi:hypothetical protein
VAAAVLALVALIVVAVLVVAGMRYRAFGGAADTTEARADGDEADRAAPEGADPFGPAPAAPPEASGDPFADLPRPDANAPEKTYTRGKLPDPGQLTGSETWQDALAIAQRGYRLMTEAVGADEAGEGAKAKRIRREAAARFEQAIESTATWVENEVSQFDRRSIQVDSIYRSIERWGDEIERLREDF